MSRGGKRKGAGRPSLGVTNCTVRLNLASLEKVNNYMKLHKLTNRSDAVRRMIMSHE